MGGFTTFDLLFQKMKSRVSTKDKHRTQTKFAEIYINNANKSVMGIFLGLKNVKYYSKIDKIC